MRQLATIQEIIDLQPIEGADMIERATILGWHLVAKKGEFKVGDRCVYFEVDSILPDRPEFEFMRDRKFRIRTIKLRGQTSQGLAMPLSILPPKSPGYVGADVTELLGVQKYDPQAEQEAKETERLNTLQMSRIQKFMRRSSLFRRLFTKRNTEKLPFPSFISKTDEERVQKVPKLFDSLCGVPMIGTEKIDGQSGTYFLVRNKRFLLKDKIVFGVCSRNYHLIKEDNSSWWTVARKFKIEETMRSLMSPSARTFVIQGEIVGPAIQKNKYGVKDYDFYLFNIVINGKRITPHADDVSAYFKTVPVVFNGVLPETIDEVVAMADGQSVLADTIREGLVFRTIDQNVSFKAISNKFLLKYKED
jgi:hypothetical protein